MRLGTEPLLPLHGTLDSFKNSLTIVREFPPLATRAFTTFTTALQLLLAQATPFLILLLLAATPRLGQAKRHPHSPTRD